MTFAVTENGRTILRSESMSAIIDCLCEIYEVLVEIRNLLNSQ